METVGPGGEVVTAGTPARGLTRHPALFLIWWQEEGFFFFNSSEIYTMKLAFD